MEGFLQDNPVFVDPWLRAWPGVGALNNVCFKINASCDAKRGAFLGVEFKTFVTVASPGILEAGLFAHELAHQEQITNKIKELLEPIENGTSSDFLDIGKDLDCACDDPEKFQEKIDQQADKIWEAIGPAYRHRGNGGGPNAPPWGEGVPGFETIGPTPVRTFRRGNAPIDGENGWICPLDRLIRQTGGEGGAIQSVDWPDWQFGPPQGPPEGFDKPHLNQLELDRLKQLELDRLRRNTR